MKKVHEIGYWSGELTIKKRDGSKLITQFSANFIRDKSEKPVAMMASFIDISKQEELEKDFETIFNSVNDGIPIVQDGLVKYANSKMVEMAGYSLEDGIGKPFSDLYANITVNLFLKDINVDWKLVKTFHPDMNLISSLKMAIRLGLKSILPSLSMKTGPPLWQSCVI
nr:PAS domain S-box protein [Methanococcoides sp. AM1]